MPEAPRAHHHGLPAVERVEHHRKAAKELLRAVLARDAAAVERLHEALGAIAAEPRLADAQRAIAREHGHATWAAFRTELEPRPARPGAPWGASARWNLRYDTSATTLLQVLATGSEPARRRLRAHVPRLARLGDAALAERAVVADARLVVAREHGFPTWRALVEGLRRETEAWHRARRHPESVAAALSAIGSGDVASLRRLLDREPGLVHVEVGAGGSLLGEVAQPDVFGSPLGRALGVDRARVELLIERGSDLDGPLNLAACFDRVELVEMLLAAGEPGGRTGDVRRDASRNRDLPRLARIGGHPRRPSRLVPDAPWIAAGAGRIDRLEALPRRTGWPRPQTGTLHRPNPADVGWLHRAAGSRPLRRTSSTRRSCTRRRTSALRAVAWLLEHGADPEAYSLPGLRPPASRRCLGGHRDACGCWSRPGADIERLERASTGTTPSAGRSTCSRESAPGAPGVRAVRDLLRSLGSHPAVWGRSAG